MNILKGSWFVDNSYLALKPWHSLFDAREEFYSHTLILVKLSSLPMELWNDYVLLVVDNLFGKAFLVDETYISSVYLTIAQILVEIVVGKGLFESVELVLSDYVFY